MPAARPCVIGARLLVPASAAPEASLQSFLFLNGCILFAVGGSLGIPYWVYLAKAPDKANAWRVAHSAITVGGIGTIALSAAWDLFRLSEPLRVVLVAGSLATGYGFGVSTIYGAIAGHRGLEWRSSVSAALVFWLMVLGTIGSVVAGPIIVYGAYCGWVA